MCEVDEDSKQILETVRTKIDEIAEDVEDCRLQPGVNAMIGISRMGNQYLNEREPWKLFKTDRNKAGTIFALATLIVKALAILSAPFVPFTAEELWKTLNLQGNVHEQRWRDALEPFPAAHKIEKSAPLFHKVEADEQELDGLLEKIRERIAQRTSK